MFFQYFKRKLHYARSVHASQAAPLAEPNQYEHGQKDNLNSNLSININGIKELLGDSNDLKVHFFRFGPNAAFSSALVYIDGLADYTTITESILRPILNWKPEELSLPEASQLMDTLRQEVLCVGDMMGVCSLQLIVESCLAGDTALLVNGCSDALVASTKGWEKRSITEPQSESVVKGPREGFTENLRTNTALIRLKISSSLLRVEQLTIGRKTRTAVCLLYLDGVADPKVVQEVKARLNKVSVDSILESGYIEEYIEDAPFSPFPTVGYSEKPDVIAGRMLEGRIAIVVDGTPFVLTVPMLFIESFQTAEDYYTRPLYASLTRILRFIAFFITLFAPAIYIALTAFHQEFIPTTLLFTIANARKGTPFPSFIEALIMVFTYEFLREAGIRMPRPVGQAISIVGALIMGDAAVNAGLVSASMVITIAMTAVAAFLVPNQHESSTILRFIIMLLGAFAGFYGVVIGFLALLVHLATLTSFGVSYFDGFSKKSNMQDSIVRMPLWSMLRRPQEIAYEDTTRRSRFFIPPLRPHAPKDDDERGKSRE